MEHIVLFKFDSDVTHEQKEEGIRRLRELKDELPGIIDLKSNVNFSDRGKGFEVSLTVRFADQSALENYRPSKEHQSVISYFKKGLSDVLEVDFKTGVE